MNHQSWIDNIIAVILFQPAFLIKAEIKKVPIVNEVLAGLEVGYVERQATKEQREAAIEEIIQRQKLIESDMAQKQMMIYPEGTQSNGEFLMPFKRGAFAGLNSVIPVVMSYDNPAYRANAWESLGFKDHLVITLMGFSLWSTCTVHQLPPFMPNEYLFKTHADKGSSEWEIYAWAVRDAMSKVSGKPLIEVDPKDKVIYKDLMTGKIDSVEKNGKTFEYPPIRKKKEKAKTQ